MQDEGQLDPLKIVELRQRALAALAQGVNVDELTNAYDQGVDVDGVADASDQGVDVGPSTAAPTTSGRSEATENEMRSNRQKEEASTHATTTGSASINVTRVERQESNFDVLKVVEARARARQANMELS
ncbi:hypothetical protein SEMRO_165_G073990.1 [Seminavis robusta]|uniref:Uncharacterized protein n=1 Tax=Seminavis robusta TaxID=568900 RepID=A0A9N8DJQ6_9STRA|nr:hypothetical protein SEMRO_165_G073990.1 [Seminavis robusta]|eukprot:Sro165_g073990.1 n/a (129) ;mRNA; r:97337-97723